MARSPTRTLLILALGLRAGAPPCRSDPPAPYMDKAAPVEARVDDLLPRLTLDEKLSIIGGVGEFNIRGIPRLGIPEIRMADGPLGVRNYPPSTAYPATIGLAASWDADLATQFGISLGSDARARGVQVVLAPAVNIVRVARNGRNFEYLSEDPFLAAAFAAQIVAGIQSQGVVSTVKHFAANNQETERMTIDETVGERALQEIYFPAFRAAVEKGHAWAVMAAYNQLNGAYCSADDWLNNAVLKGDWGFKGVLMSDWGAAHDALGAANGGLDLEMPSAKAMSPAALKPLIASGRVTLATVDDKVRRILRLEIANGFLDRAQGEESAPKENPHSAEVALRIAREAVVLLKNERNALPLNPKKVRNIVVLGPNADGCPSGGGSSLVQPFHYVSVAQGLKMLALPKLRIDEIEGRGPQGATSAPGLLTDDEAARIRAADAVVVCVGFNFALESEGFDRSFELPPGQPELIRRVAALNPRTIVILNSGGAVATEGWLDRVPALLQAWYPGQEGGHALAEILLGAQNPSGKLPVSFERRVEDSPSYGNYPGSGGKVSYAEGILVGYRWFDRKGVSPLFPFGYGLSYTSFHYGNLHIEPLNDGRFAVTFDVTNNGIRAGAEVSEVYVSPPVGSRVFRPVRELKGFGRVYLELDQTATETIVLDRGAFSYYDEAKRDWVVEPGNYTVTVGSSSRSLLLAHGLDVQ